MTNLVSLAVVCLLLGLYVAWLLRDLLRKQRADDQLEATRANRVEGHRRDLLILLRCLTSEQVEPAEACLRVKLTLNAMQSLGADTPEHEVFERMYLELQDHPVGSARQGLGKQERMRWDLKRWEVEGRYRDALLEEARLLINLLQPQSLATEIGGKNS